MRKLLFVLSALVALSLVLAACGPKTPVTTVAPQKPTEVPSTPTPVPPTPTPIPPQGAWIDSM
ncbi:MAG: hypothetical protein ACK8QZ_00355 [Anaerolineales bacterium]